MIHKFLENYAKSDITRFHMPGHKGNLKFLKKFPYDDISKYDITEIKNADFLYNRNQDGIIGDLEKRISKIYHSGNSYISTNGSTLAIQTMLSLVSGGENSFIICDRNVHSSVINTLSLLQMDAVFINAKQAHLYRPPMPTPSDVEIALRNNPGASAVLITSPNYLGSIADIKSIAKICHEFSVMLLVDNAHGAALIMKENQHPMTLGADMCSDSFHKSLPALTGSAVLHLSKKASEKFGTAEVKRHMSLFGSSSPSYLTLMSIDLAVEYLETKAKDDYLRLWETIDHLRESAKKQGFEVLDGKNTDPCKITLNPLQIGYEAHEFAEYLRSRKIECECICFPFVVLMCSTFNSKRDFNRLSASIKSIRPRPPVQAVIRKLTSEKVRPIHAMRNKKTEYVKLCESVGRICAEPFVKCPPCVPAIMPGERITGIYIQTWVV